ncbi:MAG: phosphopantetheine-binding protein [Pseudomonadota bacterium]
MTAQSAAEKELAELLVQTLNLEDVDAATIAPEEALFGEGLGLDSIDALELALAISQTYGVQLRSEDEKTREAFASLRSLAKVIEAERIT